MPHTQIISSPVESLLEKIEKNLYGRYRRTWLCRFAVNVDDDRESPIYKLMDMYHDPYVPVIRPTCEHSHWAGTESVVWKA